MELGVLDVEEPAVLARVVIDVWGAAEVRRLNNQLFWTRR